MELVKIIKYLEKKFPVKLASDWDKVGLQVFNPKQTINPHQVVERVLICLDLTKKVLDEAIHQNVDLILTRHPFIFEELNTERKNPSKKIIIQKLIDHQILVYSLHTNYDASSYQKLPFLLEQKLKIKNYSRVGVNHEGYFIKLKTKLKLKDLKNELSTIFCSTQMKVSLVWDNQQIVDQFYLFSGSGSQTMIDEKMENCVFVTGEMKWNAWIYANDNRVSVLTIGHYMENYFVEHLKEMLINAFSQVSIFTFDIQNQYN